MIVGIGIDIIEIERIAKAYRRWGESFLRRVFTEAEISYCLSKHDPAPSLAARFAAKEAAFKALSQAGFRTESWQDISVLLTDNGEPSLKVTGDPEFQLHLSLSHSNASAVALVIAEKDS